MHICLHIYTYIFRLSFSYKCCFRSTFQSKKLQKFPYAGLLSCVVDNLFAEVLLFQEISNALK